MDLAAGELLSASFDQKKLKECLVKDGGHFKFRFSSGPMPKLSKIDGKGNASELCFLHPIPAQKYDLYAILSPECKLELKVSSAIRHKRHAADSTLKMMWDDPEFTDAVISCEGMDFPVHRAVLCKASPVFAAAFRGAMKEAATARFEVQDSKQDSVKATLSYIYSGDLEEGSAPHVLPLAHRFQLDGLVTEACEKMLANLKSSNVADVVKALRPLKENKEIAQVWEQVVSRIAGDKEMCRASLENP